MADEEHDDLRPVCFMVMPFRRKPVGEPRGKDAPADVDCDALWDRAFRPAIEAMGYLPIRADYDAGSVIVKDMLERLAFADLVLADVSLPNGNVYYEIGLRHVAREQGCVLLAADWSRQLFDIDQFTSVRYPLPDGNVPPEQAEVIRAKLTEVVPQLKDSRTPYHEFITGDADELKRRGVFREQVQRVAALQTDIREVRLIEDKERRKQRASALLQDLSPAALEIAEVAIEVLTLVRDHVGWKEALELIERLPKSVRELPLVREQALLGTAKLGEHEQAIARLQELIDTFGPTPERHGLIGSSYKSMWKATRDAREKHDPDKRPSLKEKRYLKCAIEHYDAGMRLDYNEYYCACNLPELLNARGRPADEERGYMGDREHARIVDHFVMAACKRAMDRGSSDPWLRPTLLGAAFRAGDVKRAEELAEQVAMEGAAVWQLESTLKTLEAAVEQTEDATKRTALRELYEDLLAEL